MAAQITNTIIGQNLSRLREKMALTQEAMAGYLGIAREAVSQYETGARAVPGNILSKAAALFCMHEYDFYEESPALQATNIAFAFRADSLAPEDLESIASFKKIVRNYLDMKNALMHA